jgi:flagellar biosynthesis/type III secretory pathway protein FliH
MSSSSGFAPLLEDAAPTPRAGFQLFGEGEGAAAEPARTDEEPPPGAGEPQGAAFQAGYAQGREDALRDIDAVARSFATSVAEVGAFRQRLRDRYERELLELALGVARKVVLQELGERPEIWLGMIREAIRRAVDRERIVVRVPPALAGFLEERLPDVRASLAEVKELEVRSDPALAEGSCVIESRFGDVDIGVDTQLEATRAALLATED